VKRGPNLNTEAISAALNFVSMLEINSKEEANPSQSSNAVKVAVAQVQTTKPKQGKKVDNTIVPLKLVDITLVDTNGRHAEVEALPDTGANVNVMPPSIAKRFKIEKTAVSSPQCANGSELKIIGKVVTDFVHNDELYTDVEWQVASSQRVILSRSLLMQMNLIRKEFPFVHTLSAVNAEKKVEAVSASKISNDDDVNAIAAKYPEIFCGRVTLMKGKPAKIELSKDATPTSTGHYRTIANAYLDPLKKELDIQVDAGILEKMEEKPEAANYWLHPIVVVPKKGTTDIRLCVDFRKLNKFCLRPTNP
jgi:hypothetical protein